MHIRAGRSVGREKKKEKFLLSSFNTINNGQINDIIKIIYNFNFKRAV